MWQLKSYAEMRSSVVSDGIDSTSQGFSAYKSDESEDSYFLYNADMVYHLYIPFLVTSLLCLVITTFALIFLVVQKKYEKIHNLAVQLKSNNQRFHFKNLFFGLISALMVSLICVLIYGFRHIFKIGIHLKIMFGFLYWVIFVLVNILFIIALITTIFIVHRAVRKKHHNSYSSPTVLYTIHVSQAYDSPTSKFLAKNSALYLARNWSVVHHGISSVIQLLHVWHSPGSLR